MKQILAQVINQKNLTFDEAKQAMDYIMDGGATEAQTAAFLIALRMKGETVDEISGLAEVMRNKATNFIPNIQNYVDAVGTGGDGVNTFNISTTAAFVTVGAGVPMAKHGNRAISSRSGSADVMEALGINIMLEAEDVKKCVEQIGIGFMFARVFHKKMSQVSKVRNDLAQRTVFNILGPLSNPSNAKRQMIGVFDGNLTEELARVMQKLGVVHGMVVHGNDGLDEITVTSETKISEIKDGKVLTYSIAPEQFGLPRATLSEIQGGPAEENAKILLAILTGEKGAKRDIVLLNAAAAIYVGGKAESLEQGLFMAEKSIDSGAAMKVLEKFRTYTNGEEL